MRLLDLFCGEGLAAWGYWLSGRFTEIVGVDLADMSSSYSFDFVQQDALSLDYEFLMQFDFIHASPPCQAYSKATPEERRAAHPRLIVPTLRMLYAAGKPFVVENVEGSGAELKPNRRIYGFDVGLPLNRPRYFNVSIDAQVNKSHVANMSTGAHISSDRGISNRPVTHLAGAVYETVSSFTSSKPIRVHGAWVNRTDLERAFGLEVIPPRPRSRLTRDGILQGIPPAMTHSIISTAGIPKALIG